MPTEDIVSRVLRLPGYQAYRTEFDESASTVTLWVRQAASDPFYTCSGCGIAVRQRTECRENAESGTSPGEPGRSGWWSRCTGCAAAVAEKVERIDFLEGKHPLRAGSRRRWPATARTRRRAEWRPSGACAQTVRRLDKRALVSWSQRRRRRPLRYMGVDEIFWKKGQCLTVVSDLQAVEPLWAGEERKRETLDRFFTE